MKNVKAISKRPTGDWIKEFFPNPLTYREYEKSVLEARNFGLNLKRELIQKVTEARKKDGRLKEAEEMARLILKDEVVPIYKLARIINKSLLINDKKRRFGKEIYWHKINADKRKAYRKEVENRIGTLNKLWKSYKVRVPIKEEVVQLVIP
jgi:hypothetical protein